MRCKIITLNIWLGGMLFDAVVDFIRQENPDILALQEVYDGKSNKLEVRLRCFSILKQKLNFEHSSYTPAFTQVMPEGNINQGNAVFSKFPIISTDTKFYDVPFDSHYEMPADNYDHVPRNLQHVCMRAGEHDIHMYNTHGIWGRNGDDTPRRIAMCKTIASQVKGKPRTILVGDFNMDPDTRAIGQIEKHLVNVFDGELPSSFNMKRKDNPTLASVVSDMAFVSKDVRVVERYCPEVDVSDHLPLVVVVEV